MKPIRHTATLLTLALLAALTLLTPPRAHAQINYQGRLTDAAGATLPDGTYTITFSLWDSATAGTQLWGPFIADGTVGTGRGPLVDVVGGVNPNGGRFNVIIGATDTASRSLTTAMAAAASPFLQIQVAPNAAISPRQQIFATPRALRADVIPNVTPFGNNVGIGTPTAANLLSLNSPLTNGASISLTSGTFSSSIGQKSSSAADSALQFHNATAHALSNTPAFNFLNQQATTLLSINSGGNVGIGAGNNPAAKLDVRGDIKLGSTGQYFAASGEENLRIVRGRVNADGTKNSGSPGFTSGRTPFGGAGDYTITFSTPFTANPTVTTSPGFAGAITATTHGPSLSTSEVRIVTYNSAGGNSQDWEITFIAVGPR